MADRLLAGRYRLLERVGSGGMGTVWRAHDEVLGRSVAVKEIEPPEDATPGEQEVLYERVAREARAAAMLDHPGVVTVHDVVTEGGRPWIVMELVEGRSLQQAIEAEGPLAPERVARIGLRLLDALAAAHGRGLLHRDVTPANVLLAADGRVVLTDFGIAALDGDPALTRTGTLLGSPGFVAPERLRDMPYGPASDLWSLGATLYAAAEGRAPFARQEPLAALGAVLAEEAPEPRRSGALTPVLEHLLVKDPAARITAERAREALGRVADGSKTDLPRLAPHRTARVPPPRRVSLVGGVLRIVRWRRAYIGPAAIIVLAMIIGMTVWPREGGGREAGATPASPRLIRADEVDPCSLVSDQQVRGLIPEAERHTTDTGECTWWNIMVDGYLSVLPVEVRASPEEAHDQMTIRWNNAGPASAATGKRATTGWTAPAPLFLTVEGFAVPPARVPGVGDEAYSTGIRGSPEDFDCTTLRVRVSNAITGVRYCGNRQTCPSADSTGCARFAAPEAARRAAVLMAEALTRLRGRR